MSFIILKATGWEPAADDVLPLERGLCSDWEAVKRRIDRFAKANPQYPMTTISERPGEFALYRIGPEHDEGFFGNRPVWLCVHPVTPEQKEPGQ